MKAITLWPEWAWAICYLDKRVENREWAPPLGVRGKRIAIHAGAHFGGRPGRPAKREALDAVADMAYRAGWRVYNFGSGYGRRFSPASAEAESFVLRPDTVTTSAIVATAVVTGFRRGFADNVKATGWEVPGATWWLLDKVVVLDQPVPCAGKQGLWSVPDDVLRLVVERGGGQ